MAAQVEAVKCGTRAQENMAQQHVVHELKAAPQIEGDVKEVPQVPCVSASIHSLPMEYLGSPTIDRSCTDLGIKCR